MRVVIGGDGELLVDGGKAERRMWSRLSHR